MYPQGMILASHKQPRYITTEASKTRIRTTYTHETQSLSVSLNDEKCFASIEKSALNEPQNDLDMFKIKSTNIHTTCKRTPFRSTTNWTVFGLQECNEWPQNYPDMFDVKCTHMHATYILRPTFSSVLLYYEPL